LAYRYQWVWQWDATRNFAGTTEELLRHIGDKIREKLLSRPEITRIESITHSGVQYWTENLGITRRWRGTTTTVFESTEESSPIPAVVLAIVALILIAVIAAIVAFAIWSLGSTVTTLAEKAPLALTAGALALLGIVVVAGYFLVKEREPVTRYVKERVVPVAERAAGRAAEALHV